MNKVGGESMEILGIPDPWVWGAYISCILVTILCIVYGVLNWNKGDEDEEGQIKEELEWEKEENEMEEKELGF